MKKNKVDILISALRFKYNNYKKYLSNSIDYNDEKQFSIDDELSEDFYNFLKFNDFILDSSVIVTYSMFDYLFNQLCIQIQDLNRNVIYKDVKGKNDLDKKRRFIKLILSIDLNNQISKEWKEIDDYRKIRNLIVHHNSNVYFGDLKYKSNPTKQIIENIKIIKNYNSIDFDDEYGMFWIRDKILISDFMNNSLNLLKQIGQKIASTQHMV